MTSPSSQPESESPETRFEPADASDSSPPTVVPSPPTRIDDGSPTPTNEPATPGSPDSIPGYEILGEIGRGGMGVVYKALHVGLKRTTALKMVLTGAHASPEALVRFQAEAELAARLQHPNIVQVYELGRHRELPFLALEYVDGGSLDRRLNGQPHPPRESARLVEVLARAVHAAHRHGIVHRDLKPANILLTAHGEAAPEMANYWGLPKIADFGLAKDLSGTPGRTATGAIMGTPSYMASEQAEGKSTLIGPGTDVYALGAILYELLTGRPPFRGDSLLETLEQVRSRPPVAPRSLCPQIPRELEIICLKCLRKKPRDRYATAAELADDLARWLAGEAIHARPVSLGQQVLGRLRHPTLWMKAATAASLMLIGALLAIWWWVPQLVERTTAALVGVPLPSAVDPKPARPVYRPAVGAARAAPLAPGAVGIVVGVREYQFNAGKLSLAYTEADADGAARILRANDVPAENLRLLTQRPTDTAPTLANLRAQLATLAQCREEDSVTVYLSGHGVQQVGTGDFLFVPAGGEVDDPRSLLALSEIYQAFDASPANDKVLIVDACREAIGGPNPRPWPKTLEPPENVAVLFSCSAGEISNEIPSLKHGLFTYFLLQGMEGMADRARDGNVTLDELVAYLRGSIDGYLTGHEIRYRQRLDYVSRLPGSTVVVRQVQSP